MCRLAADPLYSIACNLLAANINLNFMHIRVHNLTKTFGTFRANDSISLEFAAGHIHGVLGENGAGKSTLMKLLAGFLRCDAGEIWLDGKPVSLNSPADALRAGIGMIHQDPLDIPAFTALENFFCASSPTILPNLKVAQRKLIDLAEQLGFPVQPDMPVRNMTVGQRQQLEIMRLLVGGARALILDEPTTGISGAQAAALFAALRRLAEDGKTVLFVSHKLHEIDQICHTISVLRNGRVVGEGQLHMPQPRSRLVAMMFGQPVEAEQPMPASPAPADTDQPPVWRLEQVTLREGALTLHNLNLTIHAGRVLGLAGLDGSGQQLLLRLLSGRMRPLTGRVFLQHQDMSHTSAAAFRQAGIHYLPADRLTEGLIGAFSLADHAALLQPDFLLNQRAARATAQAAINRYQIKASPDTPLAALSGGNQQRAMLALLPQYCTGLLLEQPTRGLDVASARAIWQQLLARRSAGTALVFASSDLDELLEYSDMLLVFYGGRVSPPLDRSVCNAARLAEMVGGMGFEVTDD